MFFEKSYEQNLFESEILDIFESNNNNDNQTFEIDDKYQSFNGFDKNSVENNVSSQNNAIEVIDLSKAHWIDHLDIVDLRPLLNDKSLSDFEIDPFVLIEFSNFLKLSICQKDFENTTDEQVQLVPHSSIQSYIYNLIINNPEQVHVVIMKLIEIEHSEIDKLDYRILLLNQMRQIIIDTIEETVFYKSDDIPKVKTTSFPPNNYTKNHLYLSLIDRCCHIADMIILLRGNELDVFQQDAIIKLFLLNEKRVEVVDLLLKWNRIDTLYIFCLRSLISFKLQSNESNPIDLKYYSEGRGVHNKLIDFNRTFPIVPINHIDDTNFTVSFELDYWEEKLFETVCIFEKCFIYFISLQDYFSYAIEIVQYKPNNVSTDFLMLLFDKYANPCINNAVNKSKFA